eukprot:scaffold310_cov168-Amphora_coffeaeformis.AAC.38
MEVLNCIQETTQRLDYESLSTALQEKRFRWYQGGTWYCGLDCTTHQMINMWMLLGRISLEEDLWKKRKKEREHLDPSTTYILVVPVSRGPVPPREQVRDGTLLPYHTNETGSREVDRRRIAPRHVVFARGIAFPSGLCLLSRTRIYSRTWF